MVEKTFDRSTVVRLKQGMEAEEEIKSPAGSILFHIQEHRGTSGVSAYRLRVYLSGI